MISYERSCISCIHYDGYPVIAIGVEPCWACLMSDDDAPAYEGMACVRRLEPLSEEARKNITAGNWKGEKNV